MVFDYIINKYGMEYCCNVCTFQTLQLSSIVKDISRVFEIDYDEVNNFTKTFSKNKEIASFDDLNETPEGKAYFKKYPFVLEYGKKLFGMPRQTGQHPAGICVSPVKVTDLAAVQRAKETNSGIVGFLSQYTKEEVELLGFVKIDILRLKNVTEIHWQINEINKLNKDKPGWKPITEDDIPMDDEKTWELFSNGDTLGVFQFENDNTAMPILKKVKPKNMEELSAVNAFIRPGASGLNEYLIAREDKSKIRKLDPRLDAYLEKTYGAIVYQEQIMQMISELMGISFGKADIYRRALEKPNKPKNKKLVDKFNKESIELAVKSGYSREIATKVRDLIIENSGYGFNKSHSIAYSIISYWTAWIKSNYPLVFYASLINGNAGDSDKITVIINEAKKKGIVIKPPHVNHSQYKCSIENNCIRMGFCIINGIGPKAVELIEKEQPFNSIDDFIKRTKNRAMTKKILLILISAHCMTGMGINIQDDDIINKELFNIKNNYIYLNNCQLEFWINKLIELSEIKSIPNYAIPKLLIKGKYLNNLDLVVEDDDTIVIPETKLKDLEINIDILEYKTRKKPKGCLKNNTEEKIPIIRKTLIEYQDELSTIKENNIINYIKDIENSGFSLLEHPLEKYKNIFDNFHDAKDGDELKEGGIIIELIPRISKNNKKFYWMNIQTPREIIRVTIWENQFIKNKNIIKMHNIVKIKGVKGYGGMSCSFISEVLKSGN